MAGCDGDGIEFKDEVGSYQLPQGDSDISGGAARQRDGDTPTPFFGLTNLLPPMGDGARPVPRKPGSSYFNS